MGLSYLSNHWCAGTDSECMLQQSLELPQELEQLVCFQDDFALADTSIDPLFHPPQKQPTFISQPHLPTYQNDNPSLVQDFQQQSYSKRPKTFHYSNSYQDDTQFNYNETMLACTESFFDGCYGVSSSADSELMLPLAPEFHTDEPWLLPDVAFPPVFFNGTSDRISNNSRSERVGGLSAQSIAARQRRRKIADKTQELGKLIPGGHKMNTAEMFQSASVYVKFLQAQIGMLTLTNSLQEGIKCYGDEEQHLKVLAASPVVQEKLYAQEKCLAPQKLLQSLSNDSKLQSEHPWPSVFQQINTLLMTQGLTAVEVEVVNYGSLMF